LNNINFKVSHNYNQFNNNYNNQIVIKDEKIDNDYYEENDENVEYEQNQHLNEDNLDEEHKQDGNDDYLLSSWNNIFK
jgi:hypothetical protein